MAFYRVVFLGLTVVGPEEEARLLKGLREKFHLSAEKAESLFHRVPIIVKKGISKEEMERYVKVFEEIGGRIKVEEEPTVDLYAGTSEPSESEKRIYSGRAVICPQCGFEQPATDECVKCGVVISKYYQYQEMARSMEGKVREISSEETSPWESGEGFIRAFFRTTKEVLFAPTAFFRRYVDGEGYLSPLIYGVIVGLVGWGMTIFWAWLFLLKILPMESLVPTEYGKYILGVIIPLPFQLALEILIGSSILHVCLMIVRGNNGGFRVTFRTVAYAASGHIFGVIPFLGILIGNIYTLILTILGLREGHHISTGRTVIAVFLPLVGSIIVLLLIGIAVRLFLGSAGFLGGVGI